ncbi:histidine kinase [Pedobacter sp. KR3-3]|uniref:Histidine kinase n=1 Tax=Pedobacter albus TaxID=3113905 RepID=A0ABU7I677_9SPHI|nr:histidine kinase [Pedobacter sp. KR3-3]MEE1944970.1 histidine kinase [Pedobacter sp. KR3-3]
MFLGLILLTSLQVLAQKDSKPIFVSATTKHISLLNQADYAISKKSNSKTLPDLVALNWKPLDTSLKALYEFPDAVLQYWIRFSIQNDYPNDTTLLLKVADKMQQTLLYERRGQQLRLLGQSGFGSRISDLSIGGDYWRINLPLKQGQRQEFYLLNSKYIYNIKPQHPAIETFDSAYREKIDEQVASPAIFRNIKLWVAGFYFAVFIYCCLKYFFQRKDIAYLYYALASISLFLRYSLQVDAIVLETSWLSGLNNDFIFLLSFVPQNFFYILFLAKFLEVKNNKLLHALSNFCLVQWVLMIAVMIVHYAWPEFSSITKFIWIYSSLPFLIFTLLLSYHTRPKPNRGYLQFAFIGLLTISIALLFTMAPKWFNIYRLPDWYTAITKYVDLVTIAFVIDTILFLTALAYRDRQSEIERIDLKIKNAENEHKILRLQMNPHFIFNCLNSINLYIEKNDSTLASSYLSKFSQLMRLSLVHSRKEKIVLAEEIAVLKLYLEMETMRFKGKLNYVFDIEENVDIDFIEIPPMLIQPHLENAIWHGLMHKSEGGRIIIKISQNLMAQTLHITIADNGIGRAKAAELNSKAAEKEKSYGTLITNERIAIFNQKFNADTKLQIEDLYDENNEPAGTLVSINIHLV